jgi:S-adenosylmethionine hydrolase
MAPLVTLLTDFGTADGYVAEMKGVLYSSLPGITVVDLSHDLVAHEVDLARLTVARYWRRFPPDTVHMIIVDPGMGASRDPIAVQSDGRYLVGPDNGVLSPALLLQGAQAVSLPVPVTASRTFQGRDVFAPAAVALAGGTPLESLGEVSPTPVIRRTREPTRREDGAILGEVIAFDRFGNAITNLAGVRAGVIAAAGRPVRVRNSCADVASGSPVALTGASGLLEIAVRDGSAEATLGLKRGEVVVWYRPS